MLRVFLKWFFFLGILLIISISEQTLLKQNSNKYLFKNDDAASGYKLKFERIEGVYPAPSDYNGKIVTRRHNRTTTVMDVYHDVITPLLPGKTKIKVQAYQFLSNTYRLTAIQPEVDYCMILEAGSFGVNEFSNDSNYPGKCPIGPGKFLTRNGVLPTNAGTYVNSVPPNFLGKWRLSLNYQLSGKTLYIYNYYFEVIRIIHWKS